MALTPAQQAIFNDPARFRAVSAGRRFGKTFLSMYEIARVARYPNKRVFYVAPSYRMAKQIIWDDLKSQLYKRNWAKRANESDLSIDLVNGSKISLRSADNPDSMRGVSLDFVVLDECAYMPQDAWTKVLRPTLSDRQGGALFITTPNGTGNWFYDQWLSAHDLEGWSAFQYTTIEGGNVTPEEVELARHDLDLKTFRQEYEASFETAGNIIYYAFDNANIQPLPADTAVRELHIGMDFNVGVMSATVGVKVKNDFYVVDEIVIPDSNTDELAQEIQSRYGNNRVHIYPDPAGAQRKTSALGKTDHTILREYGFEVHAPRSHMGVKDRINTVNRMLCDADNQRRMYIDPKCKRTVESLRKQQYKEGTNIPDKETGYDHQNDALGYCVSYLYPIRRNIDLGQQPQTFGHF